MKNMAVKVVDRLFIVAYGTVSPTPEEWADYLDLVAHHGVERTAQLIWTEGGEPTPAQRDELNRLLAGREVPVAVVTGSARVLLTITALSWFNRRIRAFRPSGLRDAVAYLEIHASRTELIERELGKLRDEVDADDAPRPPPPSAGLAWFLLAFVVLVVGGGGWVLVHEAERATTKGGP